MYQDTGGTLHRIGKNNHKTQNKQKTENAWSILPSPKLTTSTSCFLLKCNNYP